MKEEKKAAINYAKMQLGEKQFKENKDAVKAISEDFLAGVKWSNRNALLSPPLDVMHTLLMEHFHAFREQQGGGDKVEMDGGQLTQIIVAAKQDTYKKFPEMRTGEHHQMASLRRKL